jgi:DUF4097 and DUF4098 domain-containing protein YvlB
LLEASKKGHFDDAFISFEVKDPKKILLRVTTITDKNINITMPSFLGARGQQDYQNYVILF